MNRIVDPPREVPTGLALRILAGSIPASLFWFVPAAATLITVAKRPSMDITLQVLLELLGFAMLAMGYLAVVPDLVRSLATLRRMRTGVEATGRIVACRPAWDGKGDEMPYRAFLEDWLGRTMQSQMGKFTGCLVKLFFLGMAVPALLMALVLAVAALVNLPMLMAGGTMGGVSLRDAGAFIGMAVVLAIFIAVMLYFLRRDTLETAGDYIDWARQQAAYRAGADPATVALIATAREQARGIALKEPLPTQDSGVELICSVEFSAMGELRKASGRARLCNRLDLAGVERLLVDPLDARKVQLFVGLPDDARTDERGEWQDIPAAASGIKLALVVAAALVATVALLTNALMLYPHFHS